MRVSLVSAAVLAFAIASPALAAPKSTVDAKTVAKAYAGETEFRGLYKELVETNTTLSAGSCTLAAERMAARLKAAGYANSDINVFSTPEHPKEGGLVATLKGTDTNAKAVLMLAHIDVVEAKREDWTRDPFTLIEENGYFYARGVSDDKAMAAIFTDLLVRYKKEGFKPKRSIKLALTCGEETHGAFNGASWLSTEHKDWIDAGIAINEGAGGRLDTDGKRVLINVQAAEKVYQDFAVETTNPGGHSSQPVPANAIYDMSAALTAIKGYEFPVMLNDATRAYFTRSAKIVGGEKGAAMLAIVKDPTDKAADAVLSQDKLWHSMLRTTCVATMIEGGHAPNALPQHVKTNVNCRLFPGSSVDAVRDKLVEVIGNPAVTVKVDEPRSIATAVPTMPEWVLKPIETISAVLYPDVPVVPFMSTGATDGIYTNAAGIPTYGFSAIFGDPDGNGVHGLNERLRVKSLMDGRAFQYLLIKSYADAK